MPFIAHLFRAATAALVIDRRQSAAPIQHILHKRSVIHDAAKWLQAARPWTSSP